MALQWSPLHGDTPPRRYHIMSALMRRTTSPPKFSHCYVMADIIWHIIYQPARRYMVATLAAGDVGLIHTVMTVIVITRADTG